jgi:circadian clock protein KaiC
LRSSGRKIQEGPVLKTGIAGLDHVLCGGLPKNRLYVLQGEPGTGKTTLSLQFLREGARLGEKVLYITLSETRDEVNAVAKSHGWDLSGVTLLDLSAIETELDPDAQNTLFHPSEVELTRVTKLLLDALESVKPSRVVFDSVSELRLLSDTLLRFRRQILALKHAFNGRGVTTLLLDDLTSTNQDLQVQSLAHGVIQLERKRMDFGTDRRRLIIQKLRGVEFVGGYHDYTIEHGGLDVYPRLIASDHADNIKRTTLESGISELDSLLGGGLDSGTSTLLMGPAGSGKSTIAMRFAFEAAKQGENVAFYVFDETIETLVHRSKALKMDFQPLIDSGKITLRKINPAELSPGQFSSVLKEEVLERKIKVLVIDSMNGYVHAMPQVQFLTLQLHELFSFLNARGVVTITVLAQQGLIGTMQTSVDLTYLADTVILTRYFEAKGAVHKAVSVIKKRSGAHESTIRELMFTGKGVEVGPVLNQFEGVLSGVPRVQFRSEANDAKT